jgi:uncharacterized SAM-binding protein YcdF (DUF218 family)
MKFLIIIAAVLILIGALLFFQPGGYLVVNNAEKSDAIVMLAGDQVDLRYWRGLELLRAGYGHHFLVDAGSGEVYGQSYLDLAANFVARTAAANASQVSICVVKGDSTKEEAPQVGECLAKLQPPPHSVVLVTDDYHTRRALSIFRQCLPQIHWTAGAVHNDFLFGQPWWKNREWAKTYLTEWEKLLWWELWDRWRN